MNFIDMYFCELSNSVYDDQLLTLISEDKKKSLKSKTLMDSKLSLYSDLLVRYLICSQFNINNNELKFTKNKYGKPYLLNELNVFYNISHTHNALIVALSNKEIGVDIERVRNTKIRISNRFLTENEQNHISISNDRITAFFETWTMKEALVKYIGCGLKTTTVLRNYYTENIQSMTKTFIYKNYIMAICTDNDKLDLIDLKIMKEEEAVILFKKLTNI